MEVRYWGEVYSSPAIVNSQVFFGSFDGNLYAVGDLYDLAITDVTPSKIVVGHNFSLKLDITAANQGNYTESLRITIFANAVEIGSLNLMVLGRDSVSFFFTWNTANASMGNYTIMAVVESLPIERNIEDNTLVAGDVVCVTIPGDVDGNHYVNIFDIVRIAGTYGSTEPDPLYNATYDIDDDGDIDIYDVVVAAGHYGENWV